MIEYLKLGAAALSGSSLLIKIAVGLGLVAGILAAYGVWHHKVYRNGYDRAISDIAAADSRAIGRAQQARAVWKNCRDSGKHWDQKAGKCY
ncbi:hypothetical protein IVB46_44295 [Bradyrhizobium sp. 61]|uniref:hypothetical protein n=1 Tax=Bradyrhizobium sp. 61 TaxID=2782679 RepID=UPI001FF73F7D|nr:hypothetical protein [Bradyrhizobium sp. 61]MCK1282259.1 hypothetical protein [Bradyrhizobium sp. 61]